jgi:anti-sigma factor RsiW
LEILVEISFVSLDHPDESVLEEYVFGRLSDAKTAVLEEHILICGRCQAALAEVDEYIHLMKFAASRPLESPRRRSGTRAAIAAGGILAATAVLTWHEPHASPASVTLASFRGGAGVPVNQTAAGHPLDLSISTADVPYAAQYRLEVVTSTGESIWSGPASAGNGRLSAHFPRSLRAGMYWVRLYAQSSELLAEYGLQVK